ncbi:MAG: membrane protein insertion efficiency factor YidD [Spirochaetes bacterium]|nr:membrane protein insertion efficiency factor YidD [Spirochaetota bacterium]
MRLVNLFNFILIALVIIYKKLISPALPPSCIFYPSCSSYALEALKKYGPLRGSFLSIKRILRCHPFSKGGYDTVP